MLTLVPFSILFMVSIINCAEKIIGGESVMKKIKLLSLVISLVFCGTSFSFAAKEQIGATRKDYKWWSEARFGVFIHWGVGASIYRHGLQRQPPPKGQPSDIAKTLPVPEDIYNGKYLEWRNKGGRAPYLIYDNLYRVFDPEKFNAEEWVKAFKAAGAGYIIFTSRHHDGFCMWNTKTTDYNIMNTPFKRDVCKELADACHKYDMPLLWYYSILDLYDSRYDVKNPKPFEKVLFGQVHELLTNYGKIAGIWWDGGHVQYNTKKMCEMIRECQPGAIYNGRAWGGKHGLAFGSPEQRLGSFNMDRPWETCAVIHDAYWFWNGGKNIKSLNMCLGMLIDCASGDGNLALDFGPCPDGTIFPTIKERYLGMGQWLKKYGETIYKTRGGPYKPGLWGGSTRNGKNVYLHIIQEWPGGILELPPLPAEIKKCEALTGGEPAFEQTPEKLIIRLDAKYHQKPDTIIVLTLNRDVMSIEPIDTMINGKTLTVNARASASSSVNKNFHRGAPETVVSYSFETGKIAKHFGEESSEDRIDINRAVKCPFSEEEKARVKEIIGRSQYGHFWRFWMPVKNDKQPWLMLDLWKPVVFSRVGIRELYGQIRGYKLQYLDGDEWKTFYEGKRVDQLQIQLQKPVTARKVRLLITETDGNPPSIVKFDLFSSTHQQHKTPEGGGPS